MNNDYIPIFDITDETQVTRTWTWTWTWTRTWTCRGNVCLSDEHRTFYASNQKCDLVKVTLGNIAHLTQAIVELLRYRVNYWIGLKRNSVKKWNNGKCHAI